MMNRSVVMVCVMCYVVDVMKDWELGVMCRFLKWLEFSVLNCGV